MGYDGRWARLKGVFDECTASQGVVGSDAGMIDDGMYIWMTAHEKMTADSL